MKTCNADAKQQNLAGDARKAFMKTCLSGASEKATTSAVAPTKAEPAKAESEKNTSASPATGMNKEGKPMTAQQQRMKDCNAEAKAKEMKGDPRKAFMKNCLSNKKQS